jgi:hypothetical protein
VKLVILFLLVCTPVAVLSNELNIVDVHGRAFDLDSGNVIYHEYHCIDEKGKQQVVEYYDVSGQKILSKWLDYERGLLTPSMIQINELSEEIVAMSRLENSVNMFSNNFSKSTALNIDTDLALVMDAGFDNFIRDYWGELVAGRTITLQFPVIARQSIFNFEVKASSCKYDSQQDQCFSMEPANWFLSALVDPIELGYDSASQRLHRYRGLSNVEDRNGNGYEVDIHYQYQTSTEKQCDSIEIDPLWMQMLSNSPEAIEDNKK